MPAQTSVRDKASDLIARGERLMEAADYDAPQFDWPGFLTKVSEEMYRSKMSHEVLATMLGVNRSQITLFLGGKTRLTVGRFLLVCFILQIEPLAYFECQS